MSNSEHENVDSEIPRVELQESNSAFGRRIREFKLVNKGYENIEEFLVSAFEIYREQLTEAITEYNLIITLSYFNAVFERYFHVDEYSDTFTEKRNTNEKS